MFWHNRPYCSTPTRTKFMKIEFYHFYPSSTWELFFLPIFICIRSFIILYIQNDVCRTQPGGSINLVHAKMADVLNWWTVMKSTGWYVGTQHFSGHCTKWVSFFFVIAALDVTNNNIKQKIILRTVIPCPLGCTSKHKI